MKKSRFSDPQIISILKQSDDGVPVAQLCREHGMSSASFYKWRAKYGGMDASLISEMKQMDEENKRLKRMFADLDVLPINWSVFSWNFPFMILWPGEGEFHESIEVQRGTNRVCFKQAENGPPVRELCWNTRKTDAALYN